jgi:hypothetical protein
MPKIEFIAATVRFQKAELIQLNVEYLSWVFARIEDLFGVPADLVVGMPASEYVSSVIDSVYGARPPKGIFYLVKVDDKLAGMGGLSLLRQN